MISQPQEGATVYTREGFHARVLAVEGEAAFVEYEDDSGEARREWKQFADLNHDRLMAA